MYILQYLPSWSLMELQSQEKRVCTSNLKLLVYIWPKAVRGCSRTGSKLGVSFGHSPRSPDSRFPPFYLQNIKEKKKTEFSICALLFFGRFLINKGTFTHSLSDQYLWRSSPLDTPESKVSGEKHPDYVGSLPFLMEIDQQSNVELKLSGHCKLRSLPFGLEDRICVLK